MNSTITENLPSTTGGGGAAAPAGSVREREFSEVFRKYTLPFAFATHNPVLAELADYPEIEQHFRANYVEIEGTLGRLLVDRRRRPTGTYGRLALPCFA